MTKKQFLGCFMLFLAAFFWGSTFVAQSAGTVLPAFSFLAARSYVGALALLVVILVRALISKAVRAKHPEKYRDEEAEKKAPPKSTLLGGLICGVALTVAAAVQQFGIEFGATAGEAGFLTALYMFFVPLFGLILYKKKMGPTYLIGAVLMMAGLYFLCIFNRGWSSFGVGHILMLAGAFAYAVHIMFIDRFKMIDGLWLSMIQFAVCALLSTVLALIFDHPWTFSPEMIAKGWPPVVYAGVMSSAIGFTLQIYGQKYTPAPVATVIMSLESVIALFTEWLCAYIGLVGTRFNITPWQFLGCALAFSGIVFAQLSLGKKRKEPAA